MRAVEVFCNGELAGVLTEISRNEYRFRYDDSWFVNDRKPPVSLTLPKSRQEYSNESLFPFFFNMLSEGFNHKLQSKMLKIDEKDYFGLLIATARYDTIGAITIKPIQKDETE